MSHQQACIYPDCTDFSTCEHGYCSSHELFVNSTNPKIGYYSVIYSQNNVFISRDKLVTTSGIPLMPFFVKVTPGIYQLEIGRTPRISDKAASQFQPHRYQQL